MEFTVPADHREKIRESEKKDKYVDLATEQKKKKTLEHHSDGDTNGGWCTWSNPQRIGKGLENLETSRDHPDYSITKIARNTEKSPWNFNRLAVTQNQVRNHQLVWKILKGI